MERVSTNLSNDNMQYFSAGRQAAMNDMQSRIAGQNRILQLSDDPAGAAHATRYQSFLTRLDRFSGNMQATIDQYNVAEGHMQEAVSILQKARELAVQGATGTYSHDDLKAMAASVDELLKGMVQTANAVDGDGTAVFAGQRTKNIPFRVSESTVPGGDHSYISNVEYLGDIGRRKTEIGDSKFIEMNYPGNSVFWAEHQSIASARDGRDFVAIKDASFSIDGSVINVKTGDNLYAIASKINASDAAIKAHIDPITSGLMLETTKPHQIWLKDESGSVLKDLGLLSDNETPPPYNLARSASKSGGSVFDMMISLRDNLLQGDQNDIGGRVLGGIDLALNNVLGNLGELGAKTERLQIAYKRNEKEIPDMTARLSREVDVDMTKAITDLKTLEVTHEASLATFAKLNRQTLMDFLR